ncbi:MAG: DoxX family protein, partial [Pseudomonas sp.]|nr:DoxX family protein [Pseudomonas sp.]
MNALLKSITRTHAGYGISLLRIVTGLTFAAHGSQKLFGWFGGYGLAGVAQWMESIGITPGYLMAALA